MSRVGKLPINIPAGVSVVLESKDVSVTGPKGSMKLTTLPGVNVKQEASQLIVSRVNEEPINKAKHGLTRTLINNMVVGVTQGFSKQLEVNGVGYRVALAGTDLRFNLGFSHEVVYKIPAGITATIEQNLITISGIDKQQVGQSAAEIRALRKPEPYKGKGIKYVNERIIRKSGKSGKEK